MPDYANGKIYKIVCNIKGEQYIGGTIQKLSQRLTQHVSSSKKAKKNMKSKEIILRGDYQIVLIENYPCNNKEELERKEREHIESNICVNKYIPTRTDKEWRDTNKESLSIKSKEYRESHKEVIAIKQKKYRDTHKEVIALKLKEYYDANKEEIKSRANNYYDTNKEVAKLRVNTYRIANNEAIKLKKKEYYNKNKKSIALKHKEYRDKKKQEKMEKVETPII
jgi:hypothetical protein